jgi:hypothetical protein
MFSGHDCSLAHLCRLAVAAEGTQLDAKRPSQPALQVFAFEPTPNEKMNRRWRFPEALSQFSNRQAPLLHQGLDFFFIHVVNSPGFSKSLTKYVQCVVYYTH